MSSKTKLIITAACIVSFLGGFCITPIEHFIENVDFSSITDSTLVVSNNINNLNLDTPRDGYNAWISPKGNLYMGVWEKGNLRYGTLITEKSVYEGELLNLSPHGYGIMYYNNGNIYKGNWKVGNKEGIGLKHNYDGSMFFGHWRAGLFNAPKDISHKVEDFVYGIDLSKYQNSKAINWNNLALFSDADGEVYAHPQDNHQYMHPVAFAFIKATQGINTDPHYANHLANAKKYKVIVGAYHFFTIDDDINAQIMNFIKTSKWEKGDLPPVLDLESEYRDQNAYIKKLRKYGVKKMQDDALRWLKAIEAYYKVKPIIYTSEVWKKNFLDNKEFDNYDFWLSRYYNIRPATYNSWTFWQRTCDAKPNGYNGVVDVNQYNGSFNSFILYSNSLNH